MFFVTLRPKKIQYKGRCNPEEYDSTILLEIKRNKNVKVRRQSYFNSSVVV